MIPGENGSIETHIWRYKLGKLGNVFMWPSPLLMYVTNAWFDNTGWLQFIYSRLHVGCVVTSLASG